MPVLPKGTRSSGSSREYTYATLKEKILNLELEPGTKISENEIAESIQVSRTPVREAFLRLSQEELLEVYPQSGTFVSRIDLKHVEESRFVRENIEKAIVRLACENFSDDDAIQLETNIKMQELCVEKKNFAKLFDLDEAFHKTIFYGCDKVRTWEMVHQMNSHFNRLRMLRLSVLLDWDIIISQHKQIFQLITNHNADEAEKVMMDHLRLVVIEKDAVNAHYPNYFK